MDTNRFLTIIAAELNVDRLKKEEQLEKLINNNTIDTDEKVKQTKLLLKDITLTEQTILKFNSMFSKPTENNNEQNK
jgi:hypothetical protein